MGRGICRLKGDVVHRQMNHLEEGMEQFPASRCWQVRMNRMPCIRRTYAPTEEREVQRLRQNPMLQSEENGEAGMRSTLPGGRDAA